MNSSNPDFSLAVKTCFKIWSASEQLKNWEETPNSIKNGFEELGKSINPVNPDNTFRNNVNDILRQTMSHINRAVTLHLTANLEIMNRDITKMNPMDKQHIIEVVKRQIRKRRQRGLDHVKLDRDMATLQRLIGSAVSTPIFGAVPTDPPTDMDTGLVHTLATMVQPATPPTGRLYSEVTGGSHKRPRMDSTPPQIQQQVRIVTPTSITIPAEGTSIDRRAGIRNVSDPKDKASWKVTPQPGVSILVIGSSNCRHIEQHDVPEGVQLEVFPGIRFEHATHIVETLAKTPTLEKVVIDCGLNHRSDDYFRNNTADDMEYLEEAIRRRAEEFFMIGVQTNPDWRESDRNNIRLINDRLHEGMAHSVYIEPLPAEETAFRGDGHHYTYHTMMKIWDNLLSMVKN